MKLNFRKLHRKTALLVFLPLLLSASTGLSYRIGRSWFGLSSEFGNFMLTIHEGRYLGQPLVPVYVLLVGLGLVGMVVSGLTMLKQPAKRKPNPAKSASFSPRRLHQFLAPIFFLPLAVSALTGMAFRLGKAWFGLSSEQTQLLLRIHQGSYLGSSLRSIYVLILGLGLIALLMTGLTMTGIFRRRSVR